jgi:hypothetical protein
MTAAVDPIRAVRAFLLADDDIADLVDTRIFGAAVPEELEDGMPQACIVLNPAGGGLIGRAYQNYGDTRIDVYCYGATLHEAHEVYLAVYGALKHLRREQVFVDLSDSVLLHWARASSKGVLATDPMTQWPTCLSSWQVLAAEVAST